MFKFYVFFCIGLVALMMSGAYAEDFLNAKTLLARCESEDPVALVDEITLRNNHQDWDEIAERVATGDSEWIAASGCLMTGTKGSISAIDRIILRMAWIEALPKNPTALLQVEYQGYSLERLCELPHIEPEEEFLAQYVKETLAALEKVDAPHLQEGKQSCMSRMQTTYENCRYAHGFAYCGGD